MITARVVAATLMLLLLVTACGSAPTEETTSDSADGVTPAGTVETETVATEAVETEEPPGAIVVADGQVACADTGVEAEVPEPALRQLLRDLIQNHVTRTHDLVVVAGQTGVESEETTAAYAALDENGLEIRDAVALVYDEGAGEAFVNLWRRHLQMFVGYAAGVATGDEAAQQTADQDLRGYSQDFAAFFASATGDLMPAGPTVETFDGHIDTVEALIRDTLNAAPGEDQSDQAAHDHVLELSDMITNAVQAQFPCRFPADGDSAGNAKPVAAVDADWTDLRARVAAANCDLPTLV